MWGPTRGALFGQSPNDAADFHDLDGVESADGLIKDDQLRTVNDRLSDATRLRARGSARRSPIRHVGQVGLLRTSGSRASGLIGHPAQTRDEAPKW